MAHLCVTLSWLESERTGLQDFISHHDTLLVLILCVPAWITMTLILQSTGVACYDDDNMLCANHLS